MKKTNVFIFIYSIFILLAGAYSFLRPEYNWDILPYIASAYSLETHDTAAIHDKAYSEIKNRVSEKKYAELTSSSIYRDSMTSCSKCFAEQLPFYKIKVLYVLLIYILYKTGINIVSAAVLVPAVSYILLNFICFLWLRKIINKNTVLVVTSIIISVFPFMLNSAADSTPNMLSALIIFFSMYLLIVNKNLYASLTLMLLSISARPDNIILLSLILLIMYFIRFEGIKANKIVLILIFIISAGIFKFADIWSGNYSWKILFEHSFADRIINPAEHIPVFNSEMYFNAFTKWAGLLGFSNFPIQLLIFFLVVLILSGLKFKQIFSNIDSAVIMALWASILFHFLIYPIIEDNYFIPQYLVTDIIFIKMVINKA